MALEQNEIKKVITVDLGNTTTSLKEYKKHIDELRGSLLQLDETSEEYQKIAQEVANEQNKLNEVMKVGKGVTDAAEGSYNQLTQTMAELKKQWKATGDETERADLGKQILDINNQLKDLDASTGNFQRNVGDYSNAFEMAFGKCLKGIKSLDGPLGEVGGQLMEMLPLIRTINATAVQGLTGIKAALVSTGIGALIVALGLVLSHWEDIKIAIQKTNPVTREHLANLEEIKKKVQEIRTEWDLHDIALEYRWKILQAQGKTEKEIAEARKKQAEADLKALDEENASLKKGMEDAEYLLKHKGWKEEDLFGGHYTERLKEFNNYNIRRLELEKEISDASSTIFLETEKEKTKAKIVEENKREAAEKEAAARRKRAAEEAAAEAKQKADEAKKLFDELELNSKSELEQLQLKYEEQEKLLRDHGYDTTQLTLQFERDKQAIRDKEADEAKKKLEQYYNDIKSIIDTQQDNIDADLKQSIFEIEQGVYDSSITSEEERQEAIFNVQQEALGRKMDAITAQLDNELVAATLSEEQKEELRRQYDALDQEYTNNEIKRANDIRKQYEANEKAKIKAALTTAQTIGNYTANMLDDIKEMYDKDSEEYKNMQIMQTIISGIAACIGTWAGYADMGLPGTIAAAAQTAAIITSTGIAVAKIKATNKSSSGSGAAVSVDAPQMTQVSPLLDEQADINRMTSLTENKNSDGENKLRVYVVDQDIRDANNRAEVVEENTTF